MLIKCAKQLIAKEKRPDLIIDGPLQYDAAVMADVALSKSTELSGLQVKRLCSCSQIWNTGNTTYKAVQRSADLVSIGPMLQGMRKPVNDFVSWCSGRRYRLYHRSDWYSGNSKSELILCFLVVPKAL